MAQNVDDEGSDAHRSRATVRPLRAPIPVAVWPVSGVYVGIGESYRLDATLDVDSAHALALLTIDFYGLDGNPGPHIGACTLRTSSFSVDGGHAVIRGMGRFTFDAAAPVIEVQIERRSVLRRRAPAAITFLSPMLVPGARYLCEFRSPPRQARGWEASPMGSVRAFKRPLDGTTG